VVDAATLLFVMTRKVPVQPQQVLAGEPLKLKLEFAFPAARR
jgi:hypothetical protein